MNKIAIFASGNGTNAENVIKHFIGSKNCKVSVLICNKSDAYVMKRSEKFCINTYLCPRAKFQNGDVLKMLIDMEIDYIILAGFLLMLPADIITHYNNKIINIHPSLLPKYGGKGMYGDNVHKAVSENGDTKTGITIHLVNEELDKGEILFQTECNIAAHEDFSSIATKVHNLEKEYFPKVIEDFILGKGSL
ncbi:MAG: phosphoribosylglycinamide formyltransferase [Rikenellaceae bacterium]